MITTRKILITGGNGFVGSYIADLLVQSHELGGLYDIAFNSHTVNIDPTKKIVGSVLDVQRLERAAENCDIIIHLAAVSRVEDGEIDPDNCLKVNIEGVFNAAKVAMKGGKILVFGSSREIFGNSEDIPTDENRPKNPVSLYGVTKLASELMLSKFASTDGLKHVILRFSGVYGSIRDRPERVIPRFANQARNGEDITVNGGSQVLDFTFVADVANIVVLLTRKANQLLGQHINIVSGTGISVMDLAGLVKKLAHSESRIVVRPARKYDTQRFVGDPHRLVELLGPDAKIRPLERGLEKYLSELTGISGREHLLVQD